MRYLLIGLLAAGLSGGLTWLWLNTDDTLSLSQPAAVVASSRPSDPIGIHIANLTLEEKIGQLFIIGHWREENFYHTSNLIRAYHVGGVIIMKTGEESIADITRWSAAWQRDSVTTPLMIAIDQEGGVVSRLKTSGYIQTAQPDITDSSRAYAIGVTRGTELADLGINTNFAPVLEASNNPFAFLYDRTFRDSDLIGALGRAMIVGMREAGVVAVPKHFPGHQDEPTDSHAELPVLTIAAKDFATHVTHFANVINSTQPAALMTAHVQIPSIDPDYPATLSAILLQEKLRGEIGFTGVIITDDMTMGAITNTWSSDTAALRALQAGADMILFAAGADAAVAAIARVREAVTAGTLSEDAIDTKLTRILALKQGW